MSLFQSMVEKEIVSKEKYKFEPYSKTITKSGKEKTRNQLWVFIQVKTSNPGVT